MAVLILGFVLWSLDQVGRVQTATDLLVKVKSWTAMPFAATDYATVMGRVIDVAIDGRTIMVLGFLIVGYVLSRPGAPAEAPPVKLKQVTKEPPLELHVYGGKTAVLTIRNRGKAFRLGVRARIVLASKAVDNQAPYEYRPRDLGTGETLSGIQIATYDDDLVTIYGEFNSIQQYWRLQTFDSLECCVAFTFLRLSGDHSELVQEARIRIKTALDRGTSGYSYDMVRSISAEVMP